MRWTPDAGRSGAMGITGSGAQELPSPAQITQAALAAVPAASAAELVFDLDRERRQRLVRIITLSLFVLAALLLPAVLLPTPDPAGFGAVAVAFAGTGAALLLNRADRVGAAAYTAMAGLALAVAWVIVARVYTQPGIDLVDLRFYDLFALPILLSCVLTDRRGPLVIAGCTCAFTVASLLVLKKDGPLDAYWNGHYQYEVGSFLDLLIELVVFQAFAAVIAWLGADSIQRTLLRAARADNLEVANRQIAQQAEELAAQRRRMHQAVVQIQQVHAAIARGQLDARARVDEPELLPIAMSLNLVLDRLTRLTRDETQRVQMERTAHELAAAIRRMAAGEPYSGPQYTGTPLDEALLELAKLQLGGYRGARGAGQHASSAPPPEQAWPSLDFDTGRGHWRSQPGSGGDNGRRG